MLRDGPSPPAPPGAIGRICGSEASGMADQLLEQLEWRVTPGLTPYPEALAGTEARVEAIRKGNAPKLVWPLAPPPLYTTGTSPDAPELLTPQRLPFSQSGRGGHIGGKARGVKTGKCV